MKLIVFSKLFRERTVPELIALAHEHGFEGYDLCVRPEYPINPDNAHEALGAAVAAMKQEGLSIPMVTGNFDLLRPDHPTAVPILSAMDRAGVRLIKLGYFRIDPLDLDYWAYVDEIRKALEGWQQLATQYNVKVCYHTHSGEFMGLNCAALMHMIDGFDPRHIGAYIDPAHLSVNGEAFPIGLAMVKRYLSIVSAKDVLPVREERDGHGSMRRAWVRAGDGIVDWTTVFSTLKRVGYDGPVTIHCEFEAPPEQWMDTFAREIAFFKGQRDKAAAD